MAVSKEETVAFSEIDSERFGVRVARAQVQGKNLSQIIDFCVAEQIKLLIARCATKELRTVQEMESRGFLLMDTLVYYNFDLTKRRIPDDAPRAHVRKFARDDTAQVETVAAAAFKGYYGHYHADRRLDQSKCDEGYVSWAVRSCTSKQVATEVLVAEIGKKIVGFLTLRLNSPKEMEGLLFGVAPVGQGIGVGRSLMLNGLELCKKRQVKRMLISTQVTNVAVQKVWCRVGFELAHSFYTLHKWF
ncbi:MAG: GNAT family N-acetyltransferase [Candidatus Sulfotelmatobacter sp.]